MNQFVKVLRAMGTRTQIRSTLESFSLIERVLFIILSGILIGTASVLIVHTYQLLTVITPSDRGDFTEAMIGVPRLIQPLFATSQTDKDLTQLIYSGLMTYDHTGTLVPDLAESYSVSEDALQYTFILKKGLTFHDGIDLTVDDVVYTIRSIQDPLTKSPLRTNWDGIGIETLDQNTIIFTLPNPYAGFLHNTTLGIIPKHLWESIAYEHLFFAELNSSPIGSGPYMIESIKKAKNDTEPIHYTLASFSGYARGVPHIQAVHLILFPQADAMFSSLEIYEPDALFGVTKEESTPWVNQNFTTNTGPLPRSFGLYFNTQQHPLLQDITIRRSISQSIDRDAILQETFGEYADSIHSPFPYSIEQYLDVAPPTENNIEATKSLLTKAGWNINTETGVRKQSSGDADLTFNLVTSDTPAMRSLSTLVAEQLGEVGIHTEVVLAPLSELVQDIIPRRGFDILLFGQSFTHDTNIFAYWHSSQRNDPGLNIVSYTNAKTDRLLSQALETNNTSERLELYEQFSNIISEEIPAVFLFSPRYSYLIGDDINRPPMDIIGEPHQRFADIHTWYRYTHRILPTFNK
ncbi:MAG: peptide/nickel transport system substrate-binding protein [Planctomycetota bacterium]|jgi:peptide/nickel transport system substrate-binding protein